MRQNTTEYKGDTGRYNKYNKIQRQYKKMQQHPTEYNGNTRKYNNIQQNTKDMQQNATNYNKIQREYNKLQ